MIRDRRIVQVLAAAMVCCRFLSVSPSANAVSVTSSQYGGLLFHDDFEAETAGTSSNGGAPGVWLGSGPAHVAVYDENSGGPGAAQGTKYLWLNRTGTSGSNQANAFANFGHPDYENKPVTSGTLHVEAMVYVPSGPIDFAMEMQVNTSITGLGSFPNNIVGQVYSHTSGNVYYYSSVSEANLNAGVPFAVDTWQKWAMDLDLSTSMFKVTVNGISSADLPFTSSVDTGAGEAIQSAVFRGGGNGSTFYIDAVPSHPGDFDGDGDVDGADFVAWQTHFPTSTGATLADGDADTDGDVDGADFVVWQTNFPFTPGPGVAPVPEPNALPLLFIGAMSLIGCSTLNRYKMRTIKVDR